MEQVTPLGEMKLASGERYCLNQIFGSGNQRIWKKEGNNGILLVGKNYSEGCVGIHPEGYFFEKSFLKVSGKSDGHTILTPGFGFYDFPTGEFYTQILENIPGDLKKQEKFYIDARTHTVWIEDLLLVDFNAYSRFYRSICLADKRDDRPIFLVKRGKMIAYWQQGSLRYFLNQEEKVLNFKNTKKSQLIEIELVL